MNNTTRKNKNASNRRTRVNAMTKGLPLPVSKNLELTPGEKIIAEAQAHLRKSLNNNSTPMSNNNYGFGNSRNIRAGIPDEEVVARAVDRWAIQIAEAEKQRAPQVTITFPVRVAKTLLSVLLFFLSIFSLPARIISTIFGMVKAKLRPAPQRSYNNVGRTVSMIEQGRFNSSGTEMFNW